MSTHLMTFLPLRMTCLRAVEIQARKISGRMGIEAERVKTGPGSPEFFVEPLSNGSRRQGACGRNSADTPGYPARTPVSSAQTTGNSFVFGAFCGLHLPANVHNRVPPSLLMRHCQADS